MGARRAVLVVIRRLIKRSGLSFRTTVYILAIGTLCEREVV